MTASRWHSPPKPALVFTRETWAPRAAELVGVEGRGDVTFDDAHPQATFERRDRLGQQ